MKKLLTIALCLVGLGVLLLLAQLMPFELGTRIATRVAHAQNIVLPWQTSTAYEKNHVFTGTTLYNLTVNFHTAAYRTLMIFDATAVPSDGGSQTPYACFEGVSQSTGSAESFVSISFAGNGLRFRNGIAVTVSTSTSGCTTLTSDGTNDWYQIQSAG